MLRRRLAFWGRALKQPVAWTVWFVWNAILGTLSNWDTFVQHAIPKEDQSRWSLGILPSVASRVPGWVILTSAFLIALAIILEGTYREWTRERDATTKAGEQLALYQRDAVIEVVFKTDVVPYLEHIDTDPYRYKTVYRLGIRNAGTRPMTLRATLVACEPVGRGVKVGRRLRWMDGQRDDRVVMPSEAPTDFVEIVQELVGGSIDQRLWFLSVDGEGPPDDELEKKDYRLTIEITGGPVSKSVCAYVWPQKVSALLMFSLEPPISPEQREREFERSIEDLAETQLAYYVRSALQRLHRVG